MIRFQDSFSHYGTSQLPTKYNPVSLLSGSAGISAGNGRFGGDALRLSGSGDGNLSSVAKTIDSQATWIVSFSRKFQTLAAQTIWRWRDGSTEHVDLRIDATGHYFFTRNGTPIGPTATSAAVINTGYSVISKVVIHNSAGSVDLWIDGVPAITASGIDTQNGGSASADNFIFQGTLSGDFYSDLFIMDGQGSANNDYAGGYEIRVDRFIPNADATPNDFAVIGSVSHFGAIDENPPDGDTSYLIDATSGDRELFGYTDSSNTGTILGIQVVTTARKDDAGVIGLSSVVKSSSAVEVGAPHLLTTSYSMYMDILENDPNTSAPWTQSNENAALIGFEVA